jgi:hypothetical protein
MSTVSRMHVVSGSVKCIRLSSFLSFPSAMLLLLVLLAAAQDVSAATYTVGAFTIDWMGSALVVANNGHGACRVVVV